MITWMQKHKKYLVWTIWVATITFIGAGFVGWGSYDLGSKASAIAKVGDITIKRTRFHMVYSDLYNRYREKYRGEFDDKKAEEIGLTRKAFTILEQQAKLLNYAKDIGIVVTDEELAQTLASLPIFHTNGKFDPSLYKTYLKNRRLNAKTFENALRDEMMVNKLLNLLRLAPLPLEEETFTYAFSVADKIKYDIVTPSDVNVSPTEEEIKTYWKANKEAYLTPRRYRLAVVWIDTADKPVDNNELQEYYNLNSFNYIDAEGKQLTFEQAKQQVIRDLRIQKAKRDAQLAYIEFKKGKRQADEIVTLAENDKTLSPQAWEAIASANDNDFIKPKVIAQRYAVIQRLQVIEPEPMPFEQARTLVMQELTNTKRREAVEAEAKRRLDKIAENNTTITDYLTPGKMTMLQGLNLQESLYFLQKLFTSDKEKGIITVSEKNIVYAVVDQKITENNTTKAQAERTLLRVKTGVFDPHFLEWLDRRYVTETFVKGLTR